MPAHNGARAHHSRAKPAIVRPAHKGTSCMRIAFSRLAPVILFLCVCAARHGLSGRGRSGGSNGPRSLHRQARSRLSLETRGTLSRPRPDDVRHRPHEPDLAQRRRSRQARLDALAHRRAARQGREPGTAFLFIGGGELQRPAADRHRVRARPPWPKARTRSSPKSASSPTSPWPLPTRPSTAARRTTSSPTAA